MKKLSTIGLIPFSVLFLFCMISFIGPACSKKVKGDPGPNEIWLEYKVFRPSQLSVAVGTTVSFTNKDNASHWVTGSLFSSGKIESGQTFTYTFTTAGTYFFSCAYHSGSSSEEVVIGVQ